MLAVTFAAVGVAVELVTIENFHLPLVAHCRGVLPEPCAHRARTVRPFAYSVSTRSTMPESELPWLVVAGLPVYYPPLQRG